MNAARDVPAREPGDDAAAARELRQVVRALVRNYDRATAAVLALADPQTRYDSASEVRELLRKMHDAFADIRTDAAAAIWESEKLSLAGLAQRIGVSKSRADEIVRAAKAGKQTADGGSTDGK
jgi:hypothetical protein